MRLLGIFDAIAPAASAALDESVQGMKQDSHAILTPTVPSVEAYLQSPYAFL